VKRSGWLASRIRAANSIWIAVVGYCGRLDSSTNLNANNARPFALAQLNTRLLLASIQSRPLQLTGGERFGSRRSLSRS
jgi:hypothetical protein